MNRTRVLLALLFSLTSFCAAQRELVLQQVAHPHPYYWREMYIPQVTTGPSSVAWSPDGNEVVYSMAGSLWRQRLDADLAEQLTWSQGYDYQPDWSSDGRWIVFSRYQNRAIELWLLDTNSGTERQITKNQAVNVDARWSPDGTRIAYVSTVHNGRFHIFQLRMENGTPGETTRLTGETRTDSPRYYYGPFDHEISPTWSPDGKEIIYVSNRGRIYGSGGFWRVSAQPAAEGREIHYEETTWKARPHWSPEGKRVVFSSYDRRQWHQLWTIPPEGGAPVAITYGEFDRTAPRWSPDGRRIAFISNQGGNTSLWVLEMPGGAMRQIRPVKRKHLKPTGRVRLRVLDGSGKPVPARVSATGSDSRAYAPDDAFMHADEARMGPQNEFEPHYFHTSGESEIVLPAGEAALQVMKGFKHELHSEKVQVTAGAVANVVVRLKRMQLPAKERWASGDVHVHMNYGGTYLNSPEHMVMQAQAEDVNVVHNLIVNKEQRIPDIAHFTPRPDAASKADTLLLHGQEFHTSFWGHMGLLGLKSHYLMPDYAVYPGTAFASGFPDNSTVSELAHAQGGVVGYVHPFEIEDVPDPRRPRWLGHSLPVDAALGNVDYLEVLGFSDHHTTAGVWYRLLNLGYRIAAAGGTDAMSNYASLHGPVGLNRVYVPVERLQANGWNEALRRGRSFATNGPLLGFSIDGRQIGDELKLAAGEHTLTYSAWVRSVVPLDRAEVVCNGRPVQEVKLSRNGGRADSKGEVRVSASGWCLLRAYAKAPVYPIFDNYPYATTSPIYVTVGDNKPRSPEDAEYFLWWVNQVIAASDQMEWNTAAEREAVMQRLHKARSIYQAKQKE